MLPILVLAGAALALLSCRSASNPRSSPGSNTNPDSGTETPPNWDAGSAPDPAAVRRELQGLFNGAYRINQEQGTLETVQPSQVTAFQDRLARIRDRAFRDSRAAQAYDIPQIRRFFYFDPEREGAGVLAALETLSPAQRGELHLRILSELTRASSNPFQSNALFNSMTQTMERILGEETFHEEWAPAAQTLIRSGSTLLSAWSGAVDSASNHDLAEAYFYLSAHHHQETSEFRMGPESSRPALLRSLTATNPPFSFSNTELVGNLVRYIALIASSRYLGRISFVEETNNASSPRIREANSLHYALTTALDSEDPLDEAQLRHRVVELARDYLGQGSSLQLAQRMRWDRLQLGIQLHRMLENPSFGPDLETGLRNSLYSPSSSNVGPILLPGDLQRLTRSSLSSLEISVAQIPAAWRQAARSIDLPGGQNLEALIDAQVRSISVVSHQSEIEYGLDFLAHHILVTVTPGEPWNSFFDLAVGAYRLSAGAMGPGATTASTLRRARNERLFQNLVRRQLIGNGHQPASLRELYRQAELAVQVRFLNQQLGFMDSDFEFREQSPLDSNRQASHDWEGEYNQQYFSETNTRRIIEEYDRLRELYPSLARRLPTSRNNRTPQIRHQTR